MNETIKENNSSFLLLAHYATFGTHDLLTDYLNKVTKAKYVTRIDIPLPDLVLIKKICIVFFCKEKTLRKLHIRTVLKPRSFAYAVQFIQLLYYLLLKERQKYDFVVVQNSLLALLALVLKKSRLCKKVIYLSHGFGNSRFSSSMLNRIYLFLDELAARSVDYNWCLSKRMILLRKKQGNNKNRTFWIPSSVPLSSITRSRKAKNNNIIFLGALNSTNGAMLLPDIIEKIKKSFPSIKLDIIGDGPQKKLLLSEIKKRRLTKSIKLLGLMDFKDYNKYITRYKLALAPYKFSKHGLLQFTDPMKIRIYMMACLPIIVTQGFGFSREISKNKIGFSEEEDANKIAKLVLLLLQDSRTYDKMRLKMMNYSKRYDQDIYFRKAIKALSLD